MKPTGDIVALLTAIHDRDEYAALCFWDSFRESVTRFAERWLSRYPALQRLYDADDLAQDVWLRFFSNLTSERFELLSSQQIQRLLRQFTRDAARDAWRWQRRRRRDILRTELVDAARVVADRRPAPDRIVETQEFVACQLKRLCQRDLEIIRDWMAGFTWAEIAEHEGINVDAARKRFRRALAEVATYPGGPPWAR